MTRRLFLAAVLPPDLAGRLHEAAVRLAGELHGRATRLENLHLTVAFFGAVEETAVAALEDGLAELTRAAAPAELSFRGLTWGPPRRPPTMAWASFQESPPLTALTASIYDRCRRLTEMEPPRTDGVRHVTLARWRQPLDQRGRAALPALSLPQAAATWRVASLELFESHLRPDGPIYTPRKSFTLSGVSAN